MRKAVTAGHPAATSNARERQKRRAEVLGEAVAMVTAARLGAVGEGGRISSFWAGKTPCWEMTRCAPQIRDECPAYTHRTLPCWEIEGTYCKLTMGGSCVSGCDTSICQTCRVYKKYGEGKPIDLKLLGAGIDASISPSVDGSHAVKIFRDIQTVINETREQAGALIPVLQRAKGLIGYLPLPVLRSIAREMRVSLSEVYGIASFYSLFTMVPRGKHIISMCMGTSCYVRGGERIMNTLQKELGIDPGETTADGIFSLEMVRCLGCCGLSPVVAVEDKVYRRMTPTKMKEVLSTYA
jgi:NADH:ubiquinone oxidoreductase subunit E